MYILLNDSSTEPLTLSEVKTHLRIDGTDYDSILTPLIKTVRQLAEGITGRDFINKTWQLYLDQLYDGFVIQKSKLQSITSIKYYINDVLTTFDSSKYYATKSNDYSTLYLRECFPKTDNVKQVIEITFVSGYGADASYIPQALKQAMLSHITYLYENAGDCVEESKSQFKNLYSQFIIGTNLFRVI